ncbi:MAG: ABC transporter substrate-binding protein [Actinomycetota bacterium]|nr:ABC transporter substrate-binding protein [Actinomycetota bacterium]
MSAGGRSRHAGVLAALLAVGMLGTAHAVAAGAAPEATGGGTLVVGKSFDLVTMDPGRMFETTGGIIIPAMYDTLLTFENNDVTEPVPSLATTWEVNADATEFTFTLRDDAVFSDGSSVEAADVAFSLNRVRELKGNGSFLMEGVTAEAVDAATVVLTTEAPNPALPRILPTPTLGILNSDVVVENGGTDQPGADVDDAAEEFLNGESAGSGPYVLESFSTTSETVIAANPGYVGSTPATFDRIVFRNSDVTTQAIDVQNGNADIVMDLASDQLSSLREAEGITIDETASPTLWFLFANANPEISEVTSNPDFVEAVRYGLDYAGILELAGEGAVQAPGVIPDTFIGALAPGLAVVRDVPRAQEALARCGCEGTSVQLEYPSDLTVNGLSFGPVAERIVANLDEVGIAVELVPAPVAPALENYRAGTEQMGLWLWNPDYPDPQDYLVFGPGALVGLRAGWPAGAAAEIEAVAEEAGTTVDDATRKPLFEQFQQMLNESGPFFPLFQPTASVVSVTDRVANAAFHPTILLDIRLLAPAA